MRSALATLVMLALTGIGCAQCPAGYICRDSNACQQDSDCGEATAGFVAVCVIELTDGGVVEDGGVPGCMLVPVASDGGPQ